MRAAFGLPSGVFIKVFNFNGVDMADTKYFRSRLSGLEIVVGDPPKDGSSLDHEKVRFVPYRERYQGDNIKVGYLATDNAVALEKIKDIPDVEEISKKDFDTATGDDATELGY
jgi:hypothetical protein